MSWSSDTTRPARTSSDASTARCLRPPSSTRSPPRHASTWPSSRNRIGSGATSAVTGSGGVVGGAGHGLLLGGGSAANLHALGAAVDHTLRRHPEATREHLVLYTSRETHLSLAKAARFLGVGHVRALPVDVERRLQPATLCAALDQDHENGLIAAMVAASAGTANPGVCAHTESATGFFDAILMLQP